MGGIIALWVIGCGGTDAAPVVDQANERVVSRAGLAAHGEEVAVRAPPTPPLVLADVVGVTVRESEPGRYTFAVQVHSPDAGCARYADWWEVVGADGALRYRRILEHSHTDEQPFLRSGGPVAVAPHEEVWVRAHLAPDGYGGRVMHGTPAGGFVEGSWPAGLGAGLERAAPLPAGCAF